MILKQHNVSSLSFVYKNQKAGLHRETIISGPQMYNKINNICMLKMDCYIVNNVSFLFQFVHFLK